MKKLWLCVSVAMVVAAFLACPSSSEAQKGKGGGKGGRLFPSPGNGNGEPARPFDHPNSGNNLPQSTRDKLPPGLRDNPENHPGTANHLRKLEDSKPAGDSLNPLNNSS